MIAETAELRTPHHKIAVPDDNGKFVPPQPSNTKFSVWVRWVGLILFGMAPTVNSDALPVHGSMRIVSDYIHRSYSKSGDAPALQGQLSTVLGTRWYFGVGASMVDLGEANFEASPHLGYTCWSSTDWRAVINLAGYFYDGDLDGHAGHYGEPSATLSFRDFGSLSIGASIAPYGFDNSVPYLELNSDYPLSDVTSLSASAGYEHSREVEGEDYGYWHVGVTQYLSSHLALDLRYHGTEGINGGGAATAGDFLEAVEIGHRLVVSISVGF